MALIDAAKCVVGAQLDDDGLGPLRHRPIETVAAAGCGVTGYAGVRHIDSYTFGFQCLLQLGRKSIGAGQSKSGTQGVTEHHHFDRRAIGSRRRLCKGWFRSN